MGVLEEGSNEGSERFLSDLPSGIDQASWRALLPLLEAFPGGFHAISDIVARREAIRLWGERAAIQTPAHVEVNSFFVDQDSGPTNVRLEVRRYESTRFESGEKKPALIFIHGGGMILGDLDVSSAICFKLADAAPVAVFSLSYRKAPEDPYPNGLEDCLASIRWIYDHAEELGVNPENIGAYGPSAGGGLVLAVALKFRDSNEKILKYMMPIYPMIDDRCNTPAHGSRPILGVWDSTANRQAWEWYLAGQAADIYAAPARANDLRGLPACYSDVGTFDLFYDDDVDFFTRLAQAGVPTEFHIFPGAFHGSENLSPDSALSKKIWETRISKLRKFIAKGASDHEKNFNS